MGPTTLFYFFIKFIHIDALELLPRVRAAAAAVKTEALAEAAVMIAAAKHAIIAFYTLQMISHVLTNLEYYNAKVLEALQTGLVPFDLVLGGWAVFLLVVALGGIWRAFDPAGFNMFVNTIDNGVFNGFFGVAAQPPPAHGIFRGLFGQGGRGARGPGTGRR